MYYKILSPYISKDSSICDIACSNGDFLRFLKDNGHEKLQGIDMDKDSIIEARKNNPDIYFEVTSLNQFIDKGLRKGERYHLLTFLSIVEHLPQSDARRLIESLPKLLHKDGIAFIKIPNAGTIYNNHWLFDDITHRGYYTVRSISQLIRETGIDDQHFEVLNDKGLTNGLVRKWRLPFIWSAQLLDFIFLGKSINISYQYPGLLVIIKPNKPISEK
ncbi:methyltransferase domain-containing protein [Candidatus Dojkabacteria bacterium]|nr:methyltransferase domain-containing protein [Candidatus Dojkabacteria bacterium]